MSDVSIVLSLPELRGARQEDSSKYTGTATCAGECQHGVPEMLSIRARQSWLGDPSKRKYSAAAAPKVWAGCHGETGPGGIAEFEPRDGGTRARQQLRFRDDPHLAVLDDVGAV